MKKMIVANSNCNWTSDTSWDGERFYELETSKGRGVVSSFDNDGDWGYNVRIDVKDMPTEGGIRKTFRGRDSKAQAMAYVENILCSTSAVKASSDSEKFLAWHDDPNNYSEDRFDRIYAILDKYGTEDELVDEIFERATTEDQCKLLELAKPVATSGSAQYIIEKYREAYNNPNDDYFNGWLDAINAMIDANCLSEDIIQAIRREQQA